MRSFNFNVVEKAWYLTIVLAFLLSFSCQKPFDPALIEAQYLHIAHTRVYGEAKDKVMQEVEDIDFSGFDALILGGDLAYESSKNIGTLQYLDSVFDLKNPETLWTLGNHDYQHPELISQLTQRSTFYSFHKNGITFLNFDSQADHCNTSGNQLALFEKVTDTLNDTRTLILMHHKLIWMLDGGEMQGKVNEVANGGLGGCFHCIEPNNFYESVYPKLRDIQKSGIQVVCLAGDIGVKVNEYEYINEDGVAFLASGLKDGASANQVLVFSHHPENGKLKWEFKPLHDLPKR